MYICIFICMYKHAHTHTRVCIFPLFSLQGNAFYTILKFFIFFTRKCLLYNIKILYFPNEGYRE